YSGIHESINFMIYQIYYLGCSHAYSVINGKGESSLVELNVILDFMYENQIEFPDIKKFEKYSITEDKGWGCPFDKQDVQ
ncbi:MAG: hypothetical protein K2N90_11285, partial [Lachnospiraceae bacterium]|nr:hypothetical protein [Lachnospiraceae bacterium]